MEIKKYIQSYRTNKDNKSFTKIHCIFDGYMHHLAAVYESKFQDSGLGGYDEAYSLLQTFLYDIILKKLCLLRSDGEIYKYIGVLLKKRLNWSYIDGLRVKSQRYKTIPDIHNEESAEYMKAMWKTAKEQYLSCVQRFELHVLIEQIKIRTPLTLRKLDHNIFAILYENPSISQVELAFMFDCSKSNVNKFYTKLKHTLHSMGVYNVRHCISSYN